MEDIINEWKPLSIASYSAIGIVDFNGENYFADIYDRHSFANQVAIGALSPEVVEMLARIFNTTDLALVYIFSKKIEDDNKIKPFLDSIPIEFPDYGFLTLLSTTKDMNRIRILYDWAEENDILYLQTAFEERLRSDHFSYLLEPKHSIHDHITAAVKIASYFDEEDPENKLEQVLEGYELYCGKPLYEVLYHKLLKIEMERSMIYRDEPDGKFTGKSVNECFDEVMRFLKFCFKNNAEDLIVEIDGKNIQLHYKYKGEEFTADLQPYVD